MRERGGMTERIQAAAVVVFVLLIAAVVAVLLTRVEREAPRSTAPTSDAGQDLESAAQDPVGDAHLNSGKGDLVVRFLEGSCTSPGGPKLDLSTNLGRTFRGIQVPQVDDGTGVSAATPTVQAIVFAEATGPSSLFVAGADEQCRLRRYTTSDGGVTWEQSSGQVDQWYVDAKTGGVVSPTGPADPGCSKVVSLAPINKTSARVFCASGTIRATSNSGELWTDAGELKGVTAAVFTGAQTGYAAIPEPEGCESRIHATVDGGVTWVPRGCVLADAGIPAMSGTEERLIAGGTGGPKISTDQGKTWKAAPKKGV